ncbi:hypothetical protein HYU06_05385 [Candidatus Woesearchaeota archaeon]|nr:hypothetical protein [Candidatus Woesearchaeota archaeon]
MTQEHIVKSSSKSIQGQLSMGTLTSVLDHGTAIGPSFILCYCIGYDKKTHKLEVDAASIYRVFSKAASVNPAA